MHVYGLKNKTFFVFQTNYLEEVVEFFGVRLVALDLEPSILDLVWSRSVTKQEDNHIVVSSIEVFTVNPIDEVVQVPVISSTN